MSMGRILSAADIAASGLAAERTRMEVASGNIANAHATRTATGGAYRRQQVVFESLLGDRGNLRKGSTDGLAGVRVEGIESDNSPLPLIHDPGHPDANAAGDVEMPNVQIPREMVDLLTASRAYEANLKSLQTFQRMAEQALGLLRGMR
ncbi:MAG: flagellar basal body rod protein FlgC [Planctomycetaceae bacterium]